MKHMQGSKVREESWAKRFVDEKNYNTLLTEDTFVRKPNGDPLLVLLKNVIPPEINALAWRGLKNYSAVGGMRATASGTYMTPRIRRDGTPSNYSEVPKGWKVNSGIIGAFERTTRYPFAHQCQWNNDNPDLYKMVVPLAKKVSEVFAKTVPDKFAMQKSFVEKTDPQWMIPETVFTTITVNKNFRTSCHLDAGDLPQGFSCMSVIRHGAYSGGILILPAWGLAADMQMGDLILFDPHEYHGNTQIIPLTKGAVRCSLVYYYRELMQYCGTPEQEIEQAKRRKMGDPIFPELEK